MYNQLCTLKIKTRLFLIISIAVAGFLAMASITLVKNYTAARNAEKFRNLAELAPTVGRLIHDLQKERGTSTVYISAGNIDASDAILIRHINSTNEALDDFNAVISQKSGDLKGGNLENAVHNALARLNNLNSTRRKVPDFSVTLPQIHSYYTTTIDQLLAIISEIVKLGDNSLITKRFIAYESFIKAKEQAGQERAIGAVGFSQHKFDGETYRKYLSLSAKQETLFHLFTENASPGSIYFTNQTLFGPVLQDYIKLRNIALDSAASGTTGDISAADWFQTTTARIDLMKQVEDHLVAELVALHLETEINAINRFILILTGAVIGSGLFLAGAYIIARSISNPLGDITTAMHDIAEGNLEREVPHENMQNAVGKIARALSTFKTKVKENIELEKQTRELRVKEEESLRLKLEFERTRAAQTELEESRRRAEIANKTKSEFLANMSHELRTPLNAIIGFSGIIKSSTFGDDQVERYREYAADINQSGIHLLDIINDILDLSKVEANKIHLSESHIPLLEMIRPTLSILKHHAAEKQLKIIMDEDFLDEICLHVDERRFRQILLNLLSNAVKFTNSGGRIEIAAIPCADKGLTLEIRDNGIGMKPEDIPKALSPFGQIDSALNRQYEGTGLGLPLVKEFVELHDGILELSSEINVGTTATIWLPASRLSANVTDLDEHDIYPIGQRA